MKNGSGFTLIELLVVIAIIGILSSVVLASLSTARKKARDMRRISDVHQIQLALEIYKDQFGIYPASEVETGAPPAACWGWDSSIIDLNTNTRFFIEELELSGVMPKVPIDPSQGTSVDCDTQFAYKYHKYAKGTNGCPAERGDYYVLLVNDMETVNGLSGQHAQSSGFTCSGYDWNNDAQYTVGAYEN